MTQPPTPIGTIYPGASAAVGGPTSMTPVQPWQASGYPNVQVDAKVDFEFVPNQAPLSGQLFEVVFWSAWEGFTAGRALNNASTSTRQTISMDRPGDFRWGVWLGRTDDPQHYVRVRFLGEGGQIKVSDPSSGDNDEDKPNNPEPPKGGPTKPPP